VDKFMSVHHHVSFDFVTYWAWILYSTLVFSEMEIIELNQPKFAKICG
jgi:hypothetical protein